MNNPHEENQIVLLERIIRNVDTLNESLEELARSVDEINRHNRSTVIASHLWSSYRRNLAFNLESIDGAAPSTAQSNPAPATTT